MVITAAMATSGGATGQAVGIEVTLLARRATNRCQKRPRWHAKAWLNAGGEISASNIFWPKSVDLIVDALLGTGLGQASRESISQLMGRRLIPILRRLWRLISLPACWLKLALRRRR
ncbi:NAD(P)H-hydrate epimerase [Shigella flexneri]